MTWRTIAAEDVRAGDILRLMKEGPRLVTSDPKVIECRDGHRRAQIEFYGGYLVYKPSQLVQVRT